MRAGGPAAPSPPAQTRPHEVVERPIRNMPGEAAAPRYRPIRSMSCPISQPLSATSREGGAG